MKALGNVKQFAFCTIANKINYTKKTMADNSLNHVIIDVTGCLMHD